MNFDYIKSNAIFNNLSNKNFDNNSYSISNLVSKNVISIFIK